MSRPLALHGDGSNCYTKNCSRRGGHTPISSSSVLSEKLNEIDKVVESVEAKQKITNKVSKIDVHNNQLKYTLVQILQGKDYKFAQKQTAEILLMEEMDAFKREVASAKLSYTGEGDFYEDLFIKDSSLNIDSLVMNSAHNLKTIQSIAGDNKKVTVFQEAARSYESLKQNIIQLFPDTYNRVEAIYYLDNKKVEFSTLENKILEQVAMKRYSAIVGGINSGLGKKLEYPLMRTLCEAYGVSKDNRDETSSVNKKLKGVNGRQIDYHLINKQGKKVKTEIKLVGKGNPENVDAAYARDTNIIVATHISDSHKIQLAESNILYIDFSEKDSYKKFPKVLEKLGVPFDTTRKPTLKEILTIASRNEIYS